MNTFLVRLPCLGLMGKEPDLERHFAVLRDFRVKGRCLHGLSDILVLVLCGVLADCDDFAQIADWGTDNERFLRQELGLNLSNGIPSEDTLWRVMRRLKPEALQECLRACYLDMGVSLAGKASVHRRQGAQGHRSLR